MCNTMFIGSTNTPGYIMNKFEAVANLASFLMEQKGSVLATWRGRLSAKQQRELFGMFLGKGNITIDGTKETIQHTVKTGFGADWEHTYEGTFNTLNARAEARQVAYVVAVANTGTVPTWDGAQTYTVGY